MVDFRMMINGSVPGGIWAFFITYLVIIAVISYVFYSSELMTRRRYIRNLAISTGASLFLYSLLLLIFPAKPIIPNVVIAPVVSETATSEQKAFPFFLNEILRKAYPERYHAVDQESVIRYFNSHGWTHPDSILNQVRYHNIQFVVFPELQSDGRWKLEMVDTRYGGIEKYATIEPEPSEDYRMVLLSASNQVLQQLYPDLKIAESRLIEGIRAAFPGNPKQLADLLHLKDLASRAEWKEILTLTEPLAKPDSAAAIYPFYYGKACFELAKVTALDSVQRHEWINRANFYLLGAVKKDTANADYMNQLADFYLYKGEFENADNAAKAAWFLDPYNDKAYVNLGRLHKSRWMNFEFLGGEKFTSQGGLLRKALNLNPFSAEAYFFIGQLLEEERDLQDIKGGRAIEHYQTAADLNPNYLDALLNLWKLKIMARDFQASRSLFTRILSLSPGNPDAWFYMGMNFYYQSKQDSTLYYFTENLKLRDNGNAHMYLAATYEELADTANAVKHYVLRVKKRTSETDKIAASAYKRIRELDRNTWRQLNKEIPPVIEQ